MKLKMVCAVLFSVLQSISGDELVLQNGKDNYTGCSDSYTDDKNASSNYGAEKILKTVFPT